MIFSITCFVRNLFNSLRRIDAVLDMFIQKIFVVTAAKYRVKTILTMIFQASNLMSFASLAFSILNKSINAIQSNNECTFKNIH